MGTIISNTDIKDWLHNEAFEDNLAGHLHSSQLFRETLNYVESLENDLMEKSAKIIELEKRIDGLLSITDNFMLIGISAKTEDPK